jgi:hypothetical protein
MLFYPQSAVSQGMCFNFLSFRCFHLRFTFESIKELGSASTCLSLICSPMCSERRKQEYYQDLSLHPPIQTLLIVILLLNKHLPFKVSCTIVTFLSSFNVVLHPKNHHHPHKFHSSSIFIFLSLASSQE